MIEIPEWADPARRRAEVDREHNRLRVRSHHDEPWVEVELERPVRQYLSADGLVLVSWASLDDEADEEPQLEPDAAVLTAYDYAGRECWTLHGRDLPYFGRDGTRGQGWSVVSQINAADRRWLRIGSGGWYCELLDAGTPTLGPARRA